MKAELLLREAILSIIQADKNRIGAIYCDMDGVLVDFEDGALRLVKYIFESHPHSAYSIRSKTISTSIDKIRASRGEDWVPTSQSDLDDSQVKQIMLQAIGFDPGTFFAKLRPLEDAGALWKFLNGLGPPVHILSAPIKQREEMKVPMGTSARAGKELWVTEHLVPQPSSVIITSAVDKQKEAFDKDKGLPNLLVDDKEKTIIEWNAAGGIGILHVPGDSVSTMLAIQALL